MAATRVSPWMDMLRHRYEAGAQIADLAYWYSTSRVQMTKWLKMAGAKFRSTRKRGSR